MIWFDTTKAARSGHHSGLMRVSARLRAAFGDGATDAPDPGWTREAKADDWFLTAEVFAPEERPGFAEVLRRRPCRLAAIFHDAIPLQLPDVTWPQSVRRHPAYLKMLAGFDRVWAVSAASRRDLLGYWQWLGLARTPPVDVLALGADFDGAPRATGAAGLAPALLCVAILEPRKNQATLIEAAEWLWEEGREFELHLVGRVNPHFGSAIRARIDEVRRHRPALHYHEAMDDAALAALYGRVRAAVFPTRAEGCGLPVIEALWRGVPCVCSDLPVLRENADGGGCLMVPADDVGAWAETLRRVLLDDALCRELGAAANSRDLPTWAQAAATVRQGLAESERV